MPSDWPEYRELVLAAALPAGTDRYIALFEGNPIDGGTECADTGYARVAHQDWSTTSTTGSSTRSNSTAITFATITGTTQLTYWGIFTDAVGGTLLRSGHLLKLNGTEATVQLTGAGDDIQIPIGGLRIKQVEA